MAGTSIKVLLKEKLNTTQKAEFINLLSGISCYINGQDNIWNLLINTIPGIDTNYTSDERCFQVCIESKIPNLRSMHTTGKQYWGWDSTEVINITTFSNKDLDQKLLCLLAIKFAKLYDGLIDIGGTIHSKNASTCCYNFSSRMKKRIRSFIEKINLKGQLFELPSYSINDEFIVHVIDIEYLTNWLLHPDFHILKFPKRYVCNGPNQRLSITSYEENVSIRKGEILGH